LTLEVGKPRLLRRVQQPVVERLVSEGDAAELLAPVDVPGAHAHADLLGPRVLAVALTHAQQHPGRGCSTGDPVREAVRG